MTLSAVGLVIYSLVGDSTVTPEAAAQLLVLSLDQLRPEPNERYTYMGLAILAPAAIWASVKLCGRFGALGKSRGWLTPIVAIVGTLIAIPFNPDYPSFLRSGILASVLVTFVVAALCKFDGAKIRATIIPVVDRFNAPQREARRKLVTSLCGASIALTLTWRIFNDASAYAMLDHFDAFFYSVVQIFYGGTCLGDVLPQYGCYGEILAPALRFVGLSVLTTTVIMALLSGVSLCAMMVFARNLIHSPRVLAMAGGWVLIVQNRPLWISIQPDQYFQYTPLRTLFPALSLLIVHSWQRRRTPLKAVLMGAFAGVSICWNLDSGTVVSIALLCFLVFSGATSERFSRRSFGVNLAFGGLYLVGLLAAVAGFGAWLTIKYGQPLHVADYMASLHTFYVLGFFMLPMSFPDAWVVAIACAILVLVRFAIRMESGPYAPRLERAAYLALLAIGLFSYFNGRSHPFVFLYVSWPFVLLLGYLIDSWKPVGTALHDRVMSRILMALTAGALFVAAANISIGIPRAVAIGIKSWRQILQADDNKLFRRQVDFIRTAMGSSDSLSVMAVYQSQLLAQLGLRSAHPGPGLVETIRRHDAELQIAALVDNGPRDLFIGKDAFEGREIWHSAAPWILDSMPTLLRAYDLEGWSADGTLVHLVRKGNGRGIVSQVPP